MTCTKGRCDAGGVSGTGDGIATASAEAHPEHADRLVRVCIEDVGDIESVVLRDVPAEPGRELRASAPVHELLCRVVAIAETHRLGLGEMRKRALNISGVVGKR